MSDPASMAQPTARPGIGHNAASAPSPAPDFTDDLSVKLHRTGLVLKAVDDLLAACLENAIGNPLAGELEVICELVEVGRSHLREAQDATG